MLVKGPGHRQVLIPEKTKYLPAFSRACERIILRTADFPALEIGRPNAFPEEGNRGA